MKIWFEVLPHIQTPVIAGVHGFALGGGLEVALMCDIIVAHEKAKFGLPELKVGVFPGAGGTALAKYIGKSRAMSFILTGDSVSARQMVEWGIVNRVVQGSDPVACTKEEALRLARHIARFSSASLRLAKAAVKLAEDNHLNAGIKAQANLQSGLAGFGDVH